jgi:signal transduction histidine kinase
MRMSAIYLMITVLALVFISQMVSGVMEEFLVSQRIQTQREETIRLALEIGPELHQASAEEIYAYITERAPAMGGRVLILETDAVVQADSASQHNGFLLPYREVRDVLIGGGESAYGFRRIQGAAQTLLLPLSEQGTWAVYYAAPITAGGNYIGAILFCASIQDVVDSVNSVSRQTTMIFIIVMITVIILTFLLSGWLTQPIVELTAAIRRMGMQGYAVRVKVPAGGGELAELGTAFNRMSERIEDHDRLRDDFVANASHELKTPLATMKVLSESILYQESPDPAMMLEFFHDVDHEVDRLSRVVTELLRLVQEDRGAIELKREPLQLDALIQSVIRGLTPLAKSKSIRLTSALAPLTIQADPLRIEQVLINLIENGIKYTDAGGQVDTRLEAEAGGVTITIRDTGIGIPEDAIPHLFERFYRVDKARSRVTGGTGLGLSIAQTVVTLHGGNITVTSKPGEGSAFIVWLPAGEEAAQ